MTDTQMVANGQQAVATKKPQINVGERGLIFSTFEDMFRFAECVAKSGLAPPGLKEPAAILVALQMGAELGMSPMSSIQNVAVINNRPSVWGDAQLAVCRASGLFDEKAFVETITGTGESMVATCTVRRKPDANPVTHTFSVDDAKRARLWDKAGPWQQYPKRMLQVRARGFALRDAFADILKGFPSAEESRDIEEESPVKQTRQRRQPVTLDQLTEQIAPEMNHSELDPEPEKAPWPQEAAEHPPVESQEPQPHGLAQVDVSDLKFRGLKLRLISRIKSAGVKTAQDLIDRCKRGETMGLDPQDFEQVSTLAAALAAEAETAS